MLVLGPGNGGVIFNLHALVSIQYKTTLNSYSLYMSLISCFVGKFMYFVMLIQSFHSLPGGLSNVVKTDYFSNFATTIITRVNDFEVFDNYMFATKPVSAEYKHLVQSTELIC